MPRLLFLSLAIAIGLALPGGALAGPIVDRAARALESDPVYVDPDAERSISAAEAERLRGRIRSAGAGPVYIAILPGEARNEAGGDAAEVIPQLARALGRRGTYAVVCM